VVIEIYAHDLTFQVHGTTAVPIYSVLLTTCVVCLLALINIGSSVAFNDLVAMSISGLYLSYMVVAALLLYRRCTGGISNARSSGHGLVNVPGSVCAWGPFHLPGIAGIAGIAVNSFALIYMTIAVFFSFWPPSWAVTVQTMNFSVVGTFGVIILSLVYYAARARHVYDGPVVEID
jgi:amino acid transporter